MNMTPSSCLPFDSDSDSDREKQKRRQQRKWNTKIATVMKSNTSRQRCNSLIIAIIVAAFSSSILTRTTRVKIDNIPTSTMIYDGVSAFTTIVQIPSRIVSVSFPLTKPNNKNHNDIDRRLYLSFGNRGNGDDGNDNSNDPNPTHNSNTISSSNRERREEDQRRKERKEDVIIGKTSAKPGEKDCVINTNATEQDYLRSASRVEQLIYQYTQNGMDAMNSLKLEKANKAFTNVFELKPEAYLWQAGIVKFYLHDYFGAAAIFARNAIQYEKKFGPMGCGPASEERIWRNAVELKYINGLKKTKRKQYILEKERLLKQQQEVSTTTTSLISTSTPIIPQIQEQKLQEQKEDDNDDEYPMVETRLVLKLVTDLFDASLQQNVAIEVVARAQLLSIAGDEMQQQGQQQLQYPKIILDRKKRKLNAWYYLALHYDVTGNTNESKRCIKMAFKLAGFNAGKSTDIMATLPLLHMTVRDWFNDDPFDDDDGDKVDNNDGFDFKFDPTENSTTTSSSSEARPVDVIHSGNATNDNDTKRSNSNTHLSNAYSDSVLEASILGSVEELKFQELKDALKGRGLCGTGSKQLLKERLFISLMDGAEF